MTMPNAALAAEGATFLVDAAGESGPSKEVSTVLSNGQIVVVWQEATGRLGDVSGFEIVAKILNADGSVSVPDFLVNSTTAGDQVLPAVTALTGGGFVAAWEDPASSGPSGTTADTHFQVFGADGHKSGREMVGSQAPPMSLAGLSNNTFILGSDIYAPDGTLVGTEQATDGNSYYSYGEGKNIAGDSGQYTNIQADFYQFKSFNVYQNTFNNDGSDAGQTIVIGNERAYEAGNNSYYGAYLSGGQFLSATVEFQGFLLKGSFVNTTVTEFVVDGKFVALLPGGTIEAMTAMGDGTAAVAWMDKSGSQHIGAVNAQGNIQEAKGAVLPVGATDVSLAYTGGKLLATFTDRAGKIEGQTFDTSYFIPLVPPTIDETTLNHTNFTAQYTQDNATVTPFATAAISDGNAGVQSLTVTVTLDMPAKGMLTNLGGGTYDASTGTYTFTGSAAAATTAIDNLVFAPAANRVAPGAQESTYLTITASDGVGPVGDGPTAIIVSTSVNDPPTIAGTVAGQTTTDSQPDHPFSGITIGDVDNPPQTLAVTVRLSNAANGTLSGAAGSYDASSGVFSITGTATVVTAAVRSLTFTPKLHQVPPGSTETTTFTIGVNDGIAVTVFDASTSVVVTGTAGPPSVTFTSIAVGGSGQLILSGNYVPGTGATSVVIKNGTTPIGTATLNTAARTWSLTVTSAAGIYKHPAAVATDTSGNSVTAMPLFTFVAGITGQPYATIVNSLAAPGGATVGQTYYAKDGSIYLTEATTQRSDGYVVYAYSGGSYFTGKSFTGYANTYNASSHLVSTAYYGVSGQAYTSYLNDFDGTGHLADRKHFGYSGLPYTSDVVTYASDGTVNGQLHYKGTSLYLAEKIATSASGVVSNRFYAGSAIAGRPYSSYENDYRGGKLIEQQFLGISKQPYSSYDYFYDAVGHIASQQTNFTNGRHALQAFEAGVTLTSVQTDTMSSTQAGTTFLFDTGYGHDTIMGFSGQLSGTGHDTLLVAKAEFADVATLLAHTQTSGANAIITGTGTDTITLVGVTKAMLMAHQGDIVVHT